MTSSDVRDVLNLPDGLSAPRPTKKQKLTVQRPNLKGLAREVHSLGGDNPIAIVPEVTQFKKRRLAGRKPAARWELRPFHNSAREDSTLILRHWRRKTVKQDGIDAQPVTDDRERPINETEDSAFAKYNVQVSVPQYSDEQYRQTLESNDWTKEETDYLMETARDFDLRWPIIWDRYEWNPPATNGEATIDGDESKAIVPTTRTRTMEDLKARYYQVAAKMMALHRPIQSMSQADFALHELMMHYNPQQEKLRKDFANNSLARSREEAREEESLLLEIKRILARSERFNEERRELYNRLDYPHAEQDINTFKSSAGLQTLLQNLMNVDKSKKRKSIMGADGVSPAGQGTQGAAQDAGRRESVAGGGHRDSVGAISTPTAAGKKGTPQQPLERRKLTEQEEVIYGVTHHDRLGSGPAFRTERINKLFTHKSHQQQNRINNCLNELDVPLKLAMPTSGTTQQFESLLGAINNLLDARKVSDKLEAEIKVEQARKEEREKQNRPTQAVEGSKAATETTADNESKAAKETVPSGTSEAPHNENLKEEGNATQDVALDVEEDAGTKEPEQAAEPGEATSTVPTDVTLAEKEKGARPGSSGTTHKRSASVLSTMSDKSSKRQKK